MAQVSLKAFKFVAQVHQYKQFYKNKQICSFTVYVLGWPFLGIENLPTPPPDMIFSHKKFAKMLHQIGSNIKISSQQ